MTHLHTKYYQQIPIMLPWYSIHRFFYTLHSNKDMSVGIINMRDSVFLDMANSFCKHCYTHLQRLKEYTAGYVYIAPYIHILCTYTIMVVMGSFMLDTRINMTNSSLFTNQMEPATKMCHRK